MTKRIAVSGVLVVAMAAMVAVEARADEQGLSAEKLLLRVNKKGRGKLAFLSKDPAIEGQPGSPIDAYLEICSPAEPEDGAFDLLAPGWKVKKKGVVKFRGGRPEVKTVLIKPAKMLKIVGNLASSEALGSVGVRLTIGDHTQCALFTGASVVRDEPLDFEGKDAAAPPDCSDATLGCHVSSASAAFVDRR